MTGIVSQKRRPLLGCADKHVSLAMDTHAETDKLLEAVVSLRSVRRLYSESHRDLETLVEGEYSNPRNTVAGVPQGSVPAPILCSLFINDAPAAPGTHSALFADDTYIYATEIHERRVLQVAPRPHCSEFVVRALEHKDK
jgi:hypothetical protein